MQAAHGANPYVVGPAVFWADQWFPWIRWTQQTSVYGPVWMLIAWGVAKLAGSNLALGFVLFKLVVLALDIGIMALVVAGSKQRSDHGHAAGFGILAYAWNPLILITVPLGGAADVALAAAIVGAILARRRGRIGLATVLLTLGALVKIYGIIGIVLHLVLVYRERGVRSGLRHTAGALGIAVAAYVPYWHGFSTFTGLFTALPLTNQSIVGLVQILFGRFIHLIGFHHAAHKAEIVMRVVAGAGLLAVVARAFTRVRDERTLWRYTIVVLVAYLYLTPWFLYWYILAPLAMVAVLPISEFTFPILVFSGTSLFSIGTPAHLKNLLPQTVVRYFPPAFVYARRTADNRARQPSGGAMTLSIPVGTATATVQPAPAAK
jgi:alpha-1,6-mannosyltransferase